MGRLPVQFLQLRHRNPMLAILTLCPDPNRVLLVLLNQTTQLRNPCIEPTPLKIRCLIPRGSGGTMHWMASCVTPIIIPQYHRNLPVRRHQRHDRLAKIDVGCGLRQNHLTPPILILRHLKILMQPVDAGSFGFVDEQQVRVDGKPLASHHPKRLSHHPNLKREVVVIFLPTAPDFAILFDNTVSLTRRPGLRFHLNEIDLIAAPDEDIHQRKRTFMSDRSLINCDFGLMQKRLRLGNHIRLDAGIGRLHPTRE